MSYINDIFFLRRKKQRRSRSFSWRKKKEPKEHPPPPRPPPILGGCKQRIAETANSLWVLVSRDTARYCLSAGAGMMRELRPVAIKVQHTKSESRWY